VGESYPFAGESGARADAHLEALRRMQNADGGWGYFPGKQSWLEPTAYAALALHDDPAADRAWKLIESWQLRDGGWRPAADVQIANWTTALCVTIATLRGEFGVPFQKGVEWLLGSSGQESRLWKRMAVDVGVLVGATERDRDLSLKGWPWKPNTSAWVEPTSHALVALKQASARVPSKYSGEIRERVRMGEAQLMDVRCRDGGWNYGSRAVMGGDLPSYPETTALALLGLQGHGDLSQSLERAGQMALDQQQEKGAKEVNAPSPLARAWLRLALRLHGVKVDLPLGTPLRDVVVTAIDAIGAGARYDVFGTREISGEKPGATS
jgi:hypothetical protein